MPSPIPRQEPRRPSRSVRSPGLAAFPGNGSGRLLHYQFRGLVGCSLALRPARSRVAPRATFASKAPTASLPPPPLRLLPAGATQLPGGPRSPLKTSSFSRRTRCSALVRRRVPQSHFFFVKVRIPPTIAPRPIPQARLAAISFVAAPKAAPMAAPAAIQILIAVPERQLFALVVCCAFINSFCA